MDLKLFDLRYTLFHNVNVITALWSLHIDQ